MSGHISTMRGAGRRGPTSVSTILVRVAYAIVLPVALILAWWFASDRSTDVYFPPLRTILQEFPSVWFHGRLTGDVVPSLLRLLAGYFLAIVVATGVGVAIGSSVRARSVAEPVLEFLRAIPPPVLVPVLMLFMRAGTTMQIVIITTGCVWPILLNTIEGVRSVDEVQRDTALTFRLGRARRLFSLTLPAASPQILTGCRQALPVAIILMVISELFASSNGLGYTVVQFQRQFQLVNMWTGIILLGLIGVALSLVFRLVEARILSWYTGLRRSERGE